MDFRWVSWTCKCVRVDGRVCSIMLFQLDPGLQYMSCKGEFTVKKRDFHVMDLREAALLLAVSKHHQRP